MSNTTKTQTKTQPESRFGAYGGRYVPETLIPALDELDEAYAAATGRSGIQARARRHARELRRPAVAAEHRAAVLGGRRHDGLAQARRSQSHRRAQDQQHRRPGAARATDGQEADHRRDRRRSARRRHRDGLRAVRPRLRRLHGRRRHAPPGAQCLSDATDGRRGRSGDVGNAHAEGRDQRSDSRLGDERQREPLHHRLRRRAGAVSANGARFPVDYRRRSASADDGTRRSFADDGGGVRRRRLERDGHLPRLRARQGRRAGRRRSGWRRTRAPSGTPRRCCAARPVSFTAR